MERNSGDSAAYELEALNPKDMLDDLEKVIQSVLDISLYNREVAAEKEESAYLQACRKAAMESLKGIGG